MEMHPLRRNSGSSDFREPRPANRRRPEKRGIREQIEEALMNLLSIGRTFALAFVLFFLPLTGRALAQWRGYSGWDWGPGTMHWWMIGWMGPIFMVVFWVLVIVAIVYFIRWLVSSPRNSHSPKAQDSALEILRNRYARGDIGKEEFEEKKRDLTS
jgi:putative membrane protein